MTKRESWVIKFPEQIVVGDIIVFNCVKYKILSLQNGLGAGSMDFGEYWSVKGKATNKLSTHYKTEYEYFWLYDNLPVPTLAGDNNEVV